jgi:hypothetical protein
MLLKPNKIQAEVLAGLQSGPVPFRKLMMGRSGAFRVVYSRLLRAGLIVQHGSGKTHDPIYVGLPGDIFPPRNMIVRRADVALLVRSGYTELEAKAALRDAIKSGGEAAVDALLEQAYESMLERGINPRGGK